jgi:hypothetical protein
MRYPLQQGFRYFLSSVTGAGVCRVFERAARVLFARRRGVTALAAALLAGAALVVVGAAPALAMVPGPAGSDPAPVCSNGTCSVTFAAAGTGQSFTVPPGVSQLAVALYGGVGGASAVGFGAEPGGGAPGGDGAEVAADLAVTPGQALGLDVGGAGQLGAGGVNGGGVSAPPGAGGGGGGGGGGATDLLTAPSGGTLLLEAGGGGGAGTPAEISGETQFDVCVTPPNTPGNEGDGGNADTAGGTGQPIFAGSTGDGITPGTGGGAGTVAGPGAAGTGGVATVTQADCGPPNEVSVFPSNGSDGTAGSGGTGGAAPAGGGGGGGGYTGGGAGGSGGSVDVAVSGARSDTVDAGGGGGGGASYIGVSGATVTDTGNSGQVNGGNGEVVLSYPDPLATGSPVYAGTAGQQLTVSAANGLLSTATAATTGPAADPLTASGPAGGTTADGGTVSVNPDGSFSYTPPPGFAGLDDFGYTVTDAAGDYATGTVTLQVQFIAQAITFASVPPSPAIVGGTYTPAATGGGSGKPVVFSIDPASSSACSISGGTVTFNAGGTCTIDANQAGSGVYLAAPQVSQSVTVQLSQPSPQSITFTSSPPSPALVNGTYTPAATGGGSGNPVVFTIDPSSASVCSISGGTITFNAPGTCQIDANQDGNAQYAPAPQQTQSVTVQLIPQSITFTTTAPEPAAPGGTYTPQATGGGSGNPVVFSIDPASAPVCSISGGTVTFTRTGTCTVDANQAGVPGQYAAAPQVSQVIAVDQAPSFVLATPQTSAAAGQVYGYVFAASGTPAPAYALAAGAPSWLSINPATGAVTGTPPAGTKSFTYSVTAANAAGKATAGPFTVRIVKSVTGEDLGLTLSCPATMTIGAAGSCTLTVTNHGTTAASSVTLAAALPATLAETSCTSSCTSRGNAYTWTVSKLAKKASASFTITVTAITAGSGQVLAAVDAATFDPNIANNTAAATIGTSH